VCVCVCVCVGVSVGVDVGGVMAEGRRSVCFTTLTEFLHPSILPAFFFPDQHHKININEGKGRKGIE